jgi:hypothetical protein
MKVEADFDWTKGKITCTKTGSEFLFKGLRTDVDKVKSMEDLDIVWVEEADKVSDESWETLIPTLRKAGSEIWFTFNTGNEDDPVYKRFVINTPPDCIICKLNYLDIPSDWLSDEIKAEAEYCRTNDPVGYRRIWLGDPGGAGGKIWANFDEKTHVKDFSWDDVRHAECYMGMDPHSKYFPFICWIARWPIDGERFDYWVYNEWPDYDLFHKYYSEVRGDKFMSDWGGLKDLADIIAINDRVDVGLKVKRRYIDTRFSKGSGGENWSTNTRGMMAELSNVGLNFHTPNERIIDIQREKILEAMRYRAGAQLTEFNRPNFFVAPWCRNMIQSLKFHRTVEGSEKEDAKYKDASDALRICFAGMATVNHVTKEEKLIDTLESSYAVSYGSGGGDSWMA